MKVAKNILRILPAVVLLCFITFNTCVAQKPIEESNLAKYLQQNADTTIIYYTIAMPFHFSTEYFIISKTGTGITYSSYTNPYKKYSPMYIYEDGGIAQKFREEDSIYQLREIDTNRYFMPKVVDYKKRGLYWPIIMQYRPWQLKDDNDTTLERSDTCLINDGWALFILLITKTEMKQLVYNNPDYYEECQPGNINRQRALKVKEVFDEVFK